MTKQPIPVVVQAALWMTGAIVSFTSMAVAGRTVSFDLDTFEIMLFRSLTGIVIVLLVGSFTGTLKQVNRTRFSLHFVRNLGHFTGQNLWFYAITVLPLAQVFALEFTTPIWAILLAPLILGERIKPMGAVAAAIGFVGILIVARPDMSTLDPGIIAAAASAVCFAVTALLTRKLTKTESITCILVYLTGLQALFGLICAGFDGHITLPTSQTLPWVVLIGCAGLLAHFCLTKALSIAPASVVMPFDFARLPVIAVVGVIVYNEPLSPAILIGAAIIFGANYLNILANRTK